MSTRVWVEPTAHTSRAHWFKVVDGEPVKVAACGAKGRGGDVVESSKRKCFRCARKETWERMKS